MGIMQLDLDLEKPMPNLCGQASFPSRQWVETNTGVSHDGQAVRERGMAGGRAGWPADYEQPPIRNRITACPCLQVESPGEKKCAARAAAASTKMNSHLGHTQGLKSTWRHCIFTQWPRQTPWEPVCFEMAPRQHRDTDAGAYQEAACPQ